MADVLLIDSGETLTVGAGDTLYIDGAIENYGTIVGIEYIEFETLDNHGTVDLTAFLSNFRVLADAGASIVLGWNTRRPHDTFTIDRKEAGSDTWETLDSNVSGTSYEDNTIDESTSYTYRITSNVYTNARATVSVTSSNIMSAASSILNSVGWINDSFSVGWLD